MSHLKFISGLVSYSIPQERCTRFSLCCALLWLYIDWFSHIHQAYFTGTVAIKRLPQYQQTILMNMDKYFMWIHYERLHNHNKAKHNKTVCIFLGIFCILMFMVDPFTSYQQYTHFILVFLLPIIYHSYCCTQCFPYSSEYVDTYVASANRIRQRSNGRSDPDWITTTLSLEIRHCITVYCCFTTTVYGFICKNTAVIMVNLYQTAHNKHLNQYKKNLHDGNKG